MRCSISHIVIDEMRMHLLSAVHCSGWLASSGATVTWLTSAGHQAEAVTPRHGTVDDLPLQWPEGLQAKCAFELILDIGVPPKSALHVFTTRSTPIIEIHLERVSATPPDHSLRLKILVDDGGAAYTTVGSIEMRTCQSARGQRWFVRTARRKASARSRTVCCRATRLAILRSICKSNQN